MRKTRTHRMRAQSNIDHNRETELPSRFLFLFVAFCWSTKALKIFLRIAFNRLSLFLLRSIQSDYFSIFLRYTHFAIPFDWNSSIAADAGRNFFVFCYLVIVCCTALICGFLIDLQAHFCINFERMSHLNVIRVNFFSSTIQLNKTPFHSFFHVKYHTKLTNQPKPVYTRKTLI